MPHEPTSKRPSAPIGEPEAGATQPIPRSPGVESVRWPEARQDAVPQDAPYAAAAPAPAVAPTRWSGRRTAAIAALALTLTSAGAVAAAAASPNGISGPTEQRGGAGFAPGNRQLGQGGNAQPGQGQQPGMGMPGQGRDHH